MVFKNTSVLCARTVGKDTSEVNVCVHCVVSPCLSACVCACACVRVYVRAACTGPMPGLRPRPVLTLSSFFFSSISNAMRAAFSSAGVSARGGMASLKPGAARCGSRSRCHGVVAVGCGAGVGRSGAEGGGGMCRTRVFVAQGDASLRATCVLGAIVAVGSLNVDLGSRD